MQSHITNTIQFINFYYFSKSIGHTPFSKPLFIGSTVLCYASGNALNFFDTSAPKNEDTSTPHTAHTAQSANNNKQTGPNLKPIITESQITAFTVHSKCLLVSYSVLGSTNIHVVKWPSGLSALPGTGILAGIMRNSYVLSSIKFNSNN